MNASPTTVDVVVPTIGRPSLGALIEALAAGGFSGRVFVVDDRVDGTAPLPWERDRPALDVVVLRGRAGGPASARNIGWRASTATWIAFLDDDVVPDARWPEQLADDLACLDGDVAGSQGDVAVPLPADRPPTDWERNVHGLSTARWATADMAYRRNVLRALGGFDERFRRAYREDADFALRAIAAGHRLVRGGRRVTHPVRPAPWHVSIAAQAGNADDALMARIHGPGWRDRAGAPRGAFARHVATTVAGAAALAGLAARRRQVAGAAAIAWAASTAAFTRARVAPGPGGARELSAMAVSSVAIPPAAVVHRLRGARASRAGSVERGMPVAAVLFDRDGTLIVDVPYNGDPAKVTPVPAARDALDRLREAGVRVGMVTNQSGIARGVISAADAARVNERVVEMLGPIDVVLQCPHGPDDGCACRKPLPGMILSAARRLEAPVERCLVVGDIGADVDAALAAGARSVLVPTAVTRPAEIAAAPIVAGDLATAVDHALGLW